MTHTAGLAFTLRRGDDVVSMTEISSMSEVVHGLLRLEGERVIVQWRTSRSTDRVGMTTIRTERDIEPVRELEVPLSALAGAQVRRLWWRWPPGLHLVLTASDLRAVEELAGEDGLKLKHPAEFAVRISRSARLAAQQFASELQLALADRALRLAEEEERLLPDGTRLGQPARSPRSPEAQVQPALPPDAGPHASDSRP